VIADGDGIGRLGSNREYPRPLEVVDAVVEADIDPERPRLREPDSARFRVRPER